MRVIGNTSRSSSSSVIVNNKQEVIIWVHCLEQCPYYQQYHHSYHCCRGIACVWDKCSKEQEKCTWGENHFSNWLIRRAVLLFESILLILLRINPTRQEQANKK